MSTSKCCFGVISGEKPSDTHKPAIDSKAKLLEDVHATVSAAELMIRLLDLYPLSPRPVDNDCDQATQGNGAGQHCPAADSPQPQAVHQQALWPTPKPSDWHSIELIAVKACMRLEWALSLTSLQRVRAKAVHKLTALLCHLLQCLVAGHLPDLGLDMQKLYKAGLDPVLTAQVDGHAACSGLASAMLSRMAVDSSLMSKDSSTARLIGAVFCKSRTAFSIIWHVCSHRQLAQAELSNLCGSWLRKPHHPTLEVTQHSVLVSSCTQHNSVPDTAVMHSNLCDAETQQPLFSAGKESSAAQAERNGPPAPSALLTATIRVLYLVTAIWRAWGKSSQQQFTM